MAKNDSIDITNIVNVGIYISELTGKIEEAQAKVKTFKDEINSLNEAGQQISKLGSTLTDYLTKPILGALSATTGIAIAFNTLQNSLSINMERVGEVINKNFDISGIAEKLAGYIDKVVTVFENLDPAIQKGILGFVGLLAAVGPILAGIGSFIGFASTLIAGVEGIGAALAALVTPVGLVTVGLVGVVTAVVANWGKIKPYIIDTVNYFIRLYNESIIVRGAVWWIATSFKNSFDNVKNILKGVWELFKTFAKNVADLFGGIGNVVEGGLTGNTSKILRGIGQIMVGSVNTLKSLASDTVDVVANMVNDIGNNVSTGIDNIFNGKKLSYITDIGFGSSVPGKSQENKKEDVFSKGISGAGKDSKDKDSFKNELQEALQKNRERLSIEKQFQEDRDALMESLAKNRKQQRDDEAKNERETLLETLKQNNEIFDQAKKEQDKATEEYIKSVNDLIESGIGNTITDLFSSIGTAIGEGGNVLDAIGSSLLQSLGGFLSELGAMMIKFGVLALLFGELELVLMFGDPFSKIGAALALIGVGAALSIAGGVIKGAVGNKGKGSGSGGAAVSTSAGANVQSYSSSYSSSGGSNGSGTVVFKISGNDLVGVLEREQDRRSRTGS
ncbi:phage tail tape measure protein [Elizabethkingia miricola]|uniref:hypothetical protein n=1 Tax=Elizabethkingia miricola TaxID=172045 RepID=UPI0038920AEE